MSFLLKFCVIFFILSFCNCATKTRQRNRQSGSNSGDRARRTRTCSPPKLLNGIVTPLYKGKMMRFDCNKGYYRLGERYSECTNGRWSLYSFPICIKSGCPTMSRVDNGKITYMNAKASAMLFCEPNFEIVGSNFAHCNGTNWDRVIGTCKETDNLPPTSCDFESESICGWEHDISHDLDFERRNGYNNKTISILTGPSVDHTVGMPFQGHYMVINTNTEVFTKKARLVSPLYRLNAEKLCFQLYYYMYGISVGTLKVYAKPESVDLQDVLIEDMETEAKNDYVIFEIKDTQGNSWHKGSGMIKNFNESFQIIIEAISGQTRLSDIAIDDVSILTDEDCDDVTVDGEDNETDAKESDIKDDSEDNSDGIFSIDSCANRCFEDSNSTVHLNANRSLSCSCSRDCNPKATCCPDFLDVCIKDDSSLGETTPETTVNATSTTVFINRIISTITSPKSNTTSSSSTIESTRISLSSTTTSSSPTTSVTTTSTKPMSTTLKPTISSSTFKSTTLMPPTMTFRTTQKSSSTSKAFSIPQIPQQSNDTVENENDEMQSRTVKTDFEEVLQNTNDEIEDEHEMMPDEEEIIMPTSEKMHAVKTNVNLSFIITTVIIAVSSTVLGSIAIFIGIKQYKKSTNPLNYKEKSENGTKRADEEFSEIRYLTSDEEALDFTLASPTSVTDL
ncbi:hypothetical protein ACKWTF_002564 [Chironomus riparius]